MRRTPDETAARINSFRALEPEWLDGAAPIHESALEDALALAEQLDVGHFGVFPTPDGGVSFERRGDGAAILDIEATGTGRYNVYAMERSERESLYVEGVRLDDVGRMLSNPFSLEDVGDVVYQASLSDAGIEFRTYAGEPAARLPATPMLVAWERLMRGGWFTKHAAPVAAQGLL